MLSTKARGIIGIIIGAVGLLAVLPTVFAYVSGTPTTGTINDARRGSTKGSSTSYSVTYEVSGQRQEDNVVILPGVPHPSSGQLPLKYNANGPVKVAYDSAVSALMFLLLPLALIAFSIFRLRRANAPKTD